MIIFSLDKPVKSNSSYGRYSINCRIKVPLGLGTTNHILFFWSKQNAMEFYNVTSKNIENSGYSEYK